MTVIAISIHFTAIGGKGSGKYILEGWCVLGQIDMFRKLSSVIRMN